MPRTQGLGPGGSCAELERLDVSGDQLGRGLERASAAGEDGEVTAVEGQRCIQPLGTEPLAEKRGKERDVSFEARIQREVRDPEPGAPLKRASLRPSDSDREVQAGPPRCHRGR